MNFLKPKQREKLSKTLELTKKTIRQPLAAPFPPAILEAYPVVLLNAIADHLSLEASCNLRLVNKSISLATLLLFTRKYLHYLKVDFTREGIQKAIDITGHYDVSRTIRFGSRITNIAFDFERYVGTSEEEGAWLTARRQSKDLIHRRMMKKNSRKAAQQSCNHEEMIGEGLYSQMLTTIFQQVESTTVEISDNRALYAHNEVGFVDVRTKRTLGTVCHRRVPGVWTGTVSTRSILPSCLLESLD